MGARSVLCAGGKGRTLGAVTLDIVEVERDAFGRAGHARCILALERLALVGKPTRKFRTIHVDAAVDDGDRSEEHTSELQSLMRISYAVFCLKKKRRKQRIKTPNGTRQRHNAPI